MDSHAEHVESTVEGYLDAFERRDVDAALERVSDDVVMVEPAGTFEGKRGVRSLLEWDVRLSPVARARREGIGLLVADNVAVEEEVLRQSYRGVEYEYPVVRIFEIDESGKIHRLRIYLDRLGMLQNLTDRLPGVQGWIFRRLIRFVIAQAEKGLPAPQRIE